MYTEQENIDLGQQEEKLREQNINKEQKNIYI
jgi:hypothetical protein